MKKTGLFLAFLTIVMLLSGCTKSAITQTQAKETVQSSLDLYWQGINNWSIDTLNNKTSPTTVQPIINRLKKEQNKLNNYSKNTLLRETSTFNNDLTEALIKLKSGDISGFSSYTKMSANTGKKLRSKLGSFHSSYEFEGKHNYAEAAAFIKNKVNSIDGNSAKSSASKKSHSYSYEAATDDENDSDSSNASNPDAYNGSTPDEDSTSSSSTTSYDTTGISDIAIEDTIKQHVSNVKVKEVSGEYHKPVTTGIDINVKDSSDYYDEGAYKKDAYHILLAIKDDYGFSDFKNITITFYMDGDALVKSSFDQSALKQINHKDSNYYNIDSVATEWNTDNLNAKYNQ